MNTLLEVKNLKVRYGNIEALHGISFDVKEGEIVTLIGANGAEFWKQARSQERQYSLKLARLDTAH